MASDSFDYVVQDALAAGLDAAPLFDRDGRIVAQAGELSAVDLRAVEGVIVRGLKGAKLVRDLLGDLRFDARDLGRGERGCEATEPPGVRAPNAAQVRDPGARRPAVPYARLHRSARVLCLGGRTLSRTYGGGLHGDSTRARHPLDPGLPSTAC